MSLPTNSVADLRALNAEGQEALREATPGPWEVGVTYNASKNARLIALAPALAEGLNEALEALDAEKAENERLRAALRHLPKHGMTIPYAELYCGYCSSAWPCPDHRRALEGAGRG